MEIKSNVETPGPIGNFTPINLKPEPKKKKVCIVGFAKTWQITPFKDLSFEIWGLNELYKYFFKFPGARADRWFEIHSPDSPSKNNEEHQKFLTECPIPIYMQQKYDKFPNSRPYPRQEIKNMVNQNMIYPGNELFKTLEYAANGSPFTNFSNQITWMILLAIYEKFEEIHIYGVDMATKEELKTGDGKMEVTGEYVWQKPSCEAAVGFALGRGIKVLIPAQSELCKYPMDYGFDTDNGTRCFLKSRKKELIMKDQQLAQQEMGIMQQLEGIKAKRHQIKGHLQEDSWLLGNHIV